MTMMNFNDHASAYGDRSLPSLIRTLAVLRLCSWEYLIHNSMDAYRTLVRMFGASIVHYGFKISLFRHFCAGENRDELSAQARVMASHGVGTILGLSVETDEGEQITKHTCDEHCRLFKESIETAAAVQPGSFVAIKITALCRPALLERLNQQWSNDIDNDMDDDDEYNDLLQRLREIASLARDLKVRVLIDAEQTYFQLAINRFALMLQREFNHRHHRRRPQITTATAAATTTTTTTATTPTTTTTTEQEEEEEEEEEAFPVIYNTYQAYLKATPDRLGVDLAAADADGDFIFAVKLVRGAYMVSERERAQARGYEDPVWPAIEDSTQSYHECLEVLMSHPRTHMVVATHNQDTVAHAVSLMHKYNIPSASPRVHFGQLMGMCDNVTYLLARSGYKAVKYVPFGPVPKVVPYLLRRAQENSSILGSAAVKNERALLRMEVRRRVGL